MSAKTTRFSTVLKNTNDLPQAHQEGGALEQGKLGRPPGKKGNPGYSQVTVYLETSVHRAARKILLDERKQFSDLVNELVSEWLRRKV